MKIYKKTAFTIVMAFLAVSLAFSGMAAAATQREYVVSLIKEAGMRDEMIGTEDDGDALAKSLGFLNNWNYESTANVNAQIQASMDVAMAPALNGLRDALNKRPMEPYFVNGMAQPIFYYGDSISKDTTGEGVVRFVVYVESDLDTDSDGKLDLVKTLVQLPRAALNGSKFSTIYEARPYIEGTGSQNIPTATRTAGDSYLASNPNLSHESLYKTAPARVPVGENSTADMVANANYKDWYYSYNYSGTGPGSSNLTYDTGNENVYEDLNWYDYFLVRGYAVVLSAGIGSAGSEGYSTCGSDVEINGFRCVIEWIAGNRKAFSDKTSNFEIKADWSNGNVGMTGRSYSGTTQFGLSTTGVAGLKTIVPVAGIASWYEYTNGQGVAVSIPYTTGLAWYVNSRLASSTWSSVYNRYAGYSQLMRKEESDLVGDYGPHWARRDYTNDNWFRDWGPGKIQIPMLIVHGANDNNVRPKQSVMMYEAAKKAGVDVKWMWHQGHHMTPTFPSATPTATDPDRPYSMYCGDYTYDEWLNMWFSHYLYGLENGILNLMPDVLALDNTSGEWVGYDAWDKHDTIVIDGTHHVQASLFRTMSVSSYEEPENYDVEFPLLDHTEDIAVKSSRAVNVKPAELIAQAPAGEENISIINSDNGSGSWQNFLDAPTAGSTVYHLDLAENVTVKGVVEVNIRAAISSLGANADNPLRMHVKLVEIAAPGTTLKYYGGNAMGSTIRVNHIKDGGSWQGGGITSHNLVEFIQTDTGTYREIAKGWMDLCNPSAGFESYTADREKRIIASENIGVYHNYTVYLQPAIHTATKGNKLAIIITTGGASSARYTGNNVFTFSVDNSATKAIIPMATPTINIGTQPVPTLTVTEGSITGTLTVAANGTMGAAPLYQWYSNTANSYDGGTAIPGATGESFTIPTTLTAGTYYYYCEVSASGLETLRSSVTEVTVNAVPDVEKPPVEPTEPGTGGGGGCNAGYVLVSLMLVPFIIRKRS